MAVTVDASSPASKTQTTSAAIVTASFTPPAGALIICCGVVGNSTASGSTSLTISDSLSGAWVTDQSETTSGAGACYIFRRSTATSGSAMTVTLTPSGSTAKGSQISVLVLDGASGSVGAHTGVTTALHGSITPTQVGSMVVCSGVNTASGLALTLETGFTALLSTNDSTNGETYGTSRLTTATTSTSAITFGWTNTAANAQSCAAEYTPAVITATPLMVRPILQSVKRAGTF